MSSKFSTKILLLLIGLAVSIAMAAPRVALIRISNGVGSLDGESIQKAQIASEGQTLKLEKSAQARIQLLGSASEVTVTGPRTLIINKKSLLAEAQKVTRGGVEVALDIGSANRAAATKTRKTLPPVAIHPVLPPVAHNGTYMVEYKDKMSFKLPKATEVKITIERIGAPDGERFYAVLEDQLLPLEIMPGFIEPGSNYRFILDASGIGSERTTYQRDFRLLTEAEQALLERMEKEMTTEYRQSKTVLPLLRLASLYDDFAQPDDVLRVLQIAYDSPHLKKNDEALRARLSASIETLEKVLKMAIPLEKQPEAP